MRNWFSFFFFSFFAICVNVANSQPVSLTTASEASLITCGPGGDLYATFGHSAIHISDPYAGVDRVYNYGTFDFNTPNFYLKFAQGKLNYMLSVSTMPQFLREYEYEGRWVYRQKLNLTQTERQQLYNFLEENALPQNRDYKYDFFYDNCSTRLRDVLENTLGDRLKYPENPKDSIQTFRDLIGLYLTNHAWSELGIDLALGEPCDRIATWRQKMFLPDFLKSNLEQAKVIHDDKTENLISGGAYILTERRNPKDEDTAGIMWIFWTLFAVAGISAVFLKARYFRWFDIVFFSVIGLLGIFIALLWFATDHSATKWNFNLLWALPTWIWGAILLIRNKPNSRFFKIHALIMFAILIFWIAIPQNFHEAVIPLTLALMMRSWAWQKSKRFSFKSQ